MTCCSKAFSIHLPLWFSLTGRKGWARLFVSSFPLLFTCHAADICWWDPFISPFACYCLGCLGEILSLLLFPDITLYWHTWVWVIVVGKLQNQCHETQRQVQLWDREVVLASVREYQSASIWANHGRDVSKGIFWSSRAFRIASGHCTSGLSRVQ